MMEPADQRSNRARIHVVVSDALGRTTARNLSSWLTRVAPSSARGTVSIALVSDQRVRALNRQYRGIDRSTDVLSFPSHPPQKRRRTLRSNLDVSKRASVSSVMQGFLGDIVI